MVKKKKKKNPVKGKNQKMDKLNKVVEKSSTIKKKV
jgi:hypothetical protein